MKLISGTAGRKAVFGVAFIGLMFGTVGLVHAHKGATGVVMERMMAMKSMGDGMKMLAQMVRGKAPLDPAKIKAAATSMKQHALAIPKLFPEGSIKGPSEAIPAIWERWPEFEDHAKSLAEFAGKLETLPAKVDKAALKPLFAGMGKTCSGCHQEFRKKKE